MHPKSGFWIAFAAYRGGEEGHILKESGVPNEIITEMTFTKKIPKTYIDTSKLECRHLPGP